MSTRQKVLIIAMLAMASAAFATVSVNVDVMTLKDADDTAIAEGIKFLVLVDKDGDGIDGANMSNYSDDNTTWNSVVKTDSFLWDADDEIIFNGASAGYGTPGYFSVNDPDANGGNLMFNLGDGIDQGDQVYTMWFAELAGAAGTPGSITEVGYYTDSNWTLPADTGLLTASDYALDQSAITVIPEPTSIALLALAGLGIVYNRRFKR